MDTSEGRGRISHGGVGDVEEVLEQPLAVLRTGGLRVELHAVHRVPAVLHGHDLGVLGAVAAPRRDDEICGQRLGLDHERVVPHPGDRARDPVEQFVPLVHHRARLAVHEACGAHHFAAERLPDRLMAQTDAEGRPFARGGGDQGDGEARLVRRARAGREHRRGGLEAEHVRHAEGVVAVHYRLLPQLAEVLHQVVREGVVVVEDEEHGIMYSLMEWLAAQAQALLAGVDEFSRWLVGAADGKSSYELTRWVFLRALGVIYLIAFLSLWPQLRGLIGPQGILPAQDLLAAARRQLGGERFHPLPTLFWIEGGPTALPLACALGMVCSVLLILNVAPLPNLVFLWVLYLSLAAVGREFLAY